MAEWLEGLARDLEQKEQYRKSGDELVYQFYCEYAAEITQVMQEAYGFIQAAGTAHDYSLTIPDPARATRRSPVWNLERETDEDEANEYVAHVSIDATIYRSSDNLDVRVSVWTRDEGGFEKLDEISRGRFSIDWLKWSVLKTLREEVGL